MTDLTPVLIGPIKLASGGTFYAFAYPAPEGTTPPGDATVLGAFLHGVLDTEGSAMTPAKESTLADISAALGGTLRTADQNGLAYGGTDAPVALTPGGEADSVGRSVEMLVTAAGSVSLQLGCGAAHIISVAASPYTQTFPYAITAINSDGTTATATYVNLH